MLRRSSLLSPPTGSISRRTNRFLLVTSSTQAFLIERQFHMAYSPLGRLIRHYTPDARRAENLFILAVTAALMLLMFANQVAWAFVKDPILANPQGPEAMTFWLSQVAFVLGFLFTCVIGFKPALTVHVNHDGVTVSGANDYEHVALAQIEEIETVPAALYHTHFSRYAQTRGFVNRRHSDVVVIHRATGPVVLGLADLDREVFVEQLAALQGTGAVQLDAQVA